MEIQLCRTVVGRFAFHVRIQSCPRLSWGCPSLEARIQVPVWKVLQRRLPPLLVGLPWFQTQPKSRLAMRHVSRESSGVRSPPRIPRESFVDYAGYAARFEPTVTPVGLLAWEAQ